MLRYEVVDDETMNGFEFTDGCGSMAPGLARRLAKLQDVRHRGDRYIPSVWQIRFKCASSELRSIVAIHIALLTDY